MNNELVCKNCPVNVKKQEFKLKYPPLSLKLNDNNDIELNIIIADIPDKNPQLLIKKIMNELSQNEFISSKFKRINLFPKTLCLQGNSYSVNIFCIENHLKDYLFKNNVTLLLGSKSYKITNYIAKFEKRKESETAEGGNGLNRTYIQKIGNNIIATLNLDSLGIIGRDIFNEEIKEKFFNDLLFKLKQALKYFENPNLIENEIIEDDSFMNEPEVFVIDSVEELEKHINYLLENEDVFFAFDTETLVGDYLSPEWFREGFDLACFSISYFNKDLNKQISFSIPLKGGYSIKEIFTEEGIQKSKSLLRKLFEKSRKGLLIGHNLMFDLNIVLKYFNFEPTHFSKLKSNLLDTLILSHLLDENRLSYNLEALAVEELNFKPWKNIIDQFNENNKDFNTFISLCIYNAKDAAATYFLYKTMKEELLKKYPKTAKILPYFSKILRNLIILENAGSKISEDALTIINNYYDNLEKEIGGFLNNFIKESGFKKEINLRSNQELIEFLKFKKVPLKVKTEKGNLKLDKHVLKDLSVSTNISSEIKEFLEKMLIYREIQKMKSGFIKNYVELKDKNNFVHPSINFHGTVTGRISMRDPNIQQVPKEGPVRRVYVPRAKGRILLAADYSQAEVRTMAIVAQEKFILQSLKEKKDPYKQLATKIYKKEYDEVTEKERKIMKVLFLSNIYGQTKYGLSHILNISLKEAEKISEDFKKAFPSLKEYQKKQLIQVLKTNEVIGTTFRIRRFPQVEIYNSNYRQKWSILERAYKPQIINFPIQGGTSDTALYNTSCLTEKIVEKGLDAILISVVHDSLMFDVDEKDAIEVYKMMNEILLKPHPLMIQYLEEEWGEGNYELVDYEIEAEAGYNYGSYDKKENPEGMRVIIGVDEENQKFIFEE